jgi:hypothetical protein
MTKPNSYFARLRRRKVRVEVRKRPYANRSEQVSVARLHDAIRRQPQQIQASSLDPGPEF